MFELTASQRLALPLTNSICNGASEPEHCPDSGNHRLHDRQPVMSNPAVRPSRGMHKVEGYKDYVEDERRCRDEEQEIVPAGAKCARGRNARQNDNAENEAGAMENVAGRSNGHVRAIVRDLNQRRRGRLEPPY